MPEDLSRTDLLHAVHAGAAPLALLDADGVIGAASEAMAELLGVCTPAELRGASVFDFLPTDADRERARHLLRDVTSGTVDGFTRRTLVRRADAQVVEVWNRSRVIHADGGAFALVALSLKGVDDAPALPTGSRASGAAVILCDHDWRIVDISRDAPEILGGAFAFRGAGLLGLVHPHDVAKFSVAATSLHAGRESVSLGLRLRTDEHWASGTMTITRLCAHAPPRLACLYWNTAPRTDSDSLDEILAELSVDAGIIEILPDVAKAALRRALRVHDLSAQQWQLVALVMTGQTIPEIAKTVFLSPGTVRNQLSDIYRAIGVHTRAELQALIYQGNTEEDG